VVPQQRRQARHERAGGLAGYNMISSLYLDRYLLHYSLRRMQCRYELHSAPRVLRMIVDKLNQFTSVLIRNGTGYGLL